MIEVNIKGEFLGKPVDPFTSGHIFKRLGPRDWVRFDHEALNALGTGQWQIIEDESILDALEVGYTYGRQAMRWQINVLE